MKYNIKLASALFAAFFLFSINNTILADSPLPNPDQSANSNYVFTNPTTVAFAEGCSRDNIKRSKVSKKLSRDEELKICNALQSVANQLNKNDWSPSVRAELRAIWDVFHNENVTIQPMMKNISRSIAAMAEGFVPNTKRGKFSANLYLRPDKAGSSDFLLVSMHELRHIYDFYMVWQNQKGISQAELEKRGFRIMSRIARETPQREKFSRLPKLWEEDWKSLTEKQISSIVESRIEKYMNGSKFYREIMNDTEKYYVGRRSKAAKLSYDSNPIRIEFKAKGGALPYLVRVKNSYKPVMQGINEISFAPAKAQNIKNPKDILAAAIENEKQLYYKMDNFVYDQKLDLKCWKKNKISESFKYSAQIARTASGKALEEQVVSELKGKRGKTEPTCVLNMNSIQSDATETFWSAPYLDEVPVKFDYFTDLGGVRVARYSVGKPTPAKIRELEEKYPHINPFRVFFGSIFIAVEDAQIIKFWGSSFPENTTTGQARKGILASYNATAIREKLTSGIWVTVSLNTVAVANKRGKQKPFSYIVNYTNYRQAMSDVKILDDDDSITNLIP